jgi:transposase
MVVQAFPVTSSTVVVAVDVGKNEFAFSVTDARRVLLLKPRAGCAMTGPSLAQALADIDRVLPAGAVVKVGIEAAGHYHRPLLNAAWPVGWEVLELNPGHVTEQRRVLGKRTIKTDVVDLQAMTELLLAGRANRSETGRWCSVSSRPGRPIGRVVWRCVQRPRTGCSRSWTARFPG